MKKFFSSEKGKRLLIGLGMLALALTLGFFLQGILLESGARWKQAIFFAVVTGTGIGGILYIFFAWKGLLITYVLIFYIALMVALSNIAQGIVGILLFLPVIIGPALLRRLLTRKKTEGDSSKAFNQHTLQQVQKEQDAWAQLQSENAPLLVAKKSSGTIYQLFCQGEILLFYKVGSFFKDLGEQNLKQQDNLPPLGKDDFKIVLKDVTTLRFHDVYSDTDTFDMEISIITWEKQYFLSAILAEGGTKLEQFLREKIPPNAQMERKTVAHFIPSLNRKRRDVIRKLYTGICAFATIVGLAWVFLDVPYHLFAWMALLPTPLLLLLHYLFPNEATLAEEKKFAHGRVMIFYALLISPVPMLFRAIIDFQLLRDGRFIAVSSILLVLLLVQAYITSEEYRIRKAQILGLVLVLGIYCFSAVSLTNALLDPSLPQEKMAIVQDKDISTTRGGDSYFLDVQILTGEEYSFRVVEYFYDEIQIGDSVNILFYKGAFGIPYAEVEQLP